jgi:hypothetical protein
LVETEIVDEDEKDSLVGVQQGENGLFEHIGTHKRFIVRFVDPAQVLFSNVAAKEVIGLSLLLFEHVIHARFGLFKF